MIADEKFNVPFTNAAMFCNNKVTFGSPYNHKIGDRSKYINVAYYFVCETVQSGGIFLL
jgi:hypothetical protein